jgi:hypothetical protein
MEPLQPKKDQRGLATFTASAWNATPFVIKACRLKALIRQAFSNYANQSVSSSARNDEGPF